MFLPGLGETVLAIQNGAPQNIPPIGSASAGKIPGIVVFLESLAFRASVRNGCAQLWVSAQGCEWHCGKAGPGAFLILVVAENSLAARE
jgi:hypothetical protein